MSLPRGENPVNLGGGKEAEGLAKRRTTRTLDLNNEGNSTARSRSTLPQRLRVALYVLLLSDRRGVQIAIIKLVG